ncbi:MAG TPA: hypothetical protein VF092_15050 [Longimicrobium sp.]
MAKLTLKVEKLAVESFETLDGARGAGTVRAHEDRTEWQDSTCATDCFPGSDWDSCLSCNDPTCRSVDCP